MADQYSWEKANQAGYKTTVQQLSRKTIADGQLLNNDIVETLSSRDKYINDNLIGETASANSVFNTVKNNSATNWDNALLSGFSAFYADSTKLAATGNNDTLTINPVNLTATVDTTNNKITFSFPDYYKDSYYQRTNRTLTPKMPILPQPWGDGDTYSRTDEANAPVIFGQGFTATNGDDLRYNRTLYINADKIKSVNDKSINGGICINPGNNTDWETRGIVINSSTGRDGTAAGIAINASRQSHDLQIAINHSRTNSTDYCGQLAMNNSVTNATGNIAFTNCTNDASMSLSMYNSTAAGSLSVSLYESNCNNRALSMYNSTAGEVSLAMYNSYAGSNGFSHALYNSTAGQVSLAMYNSINNADNINVSLYNSKAADGGAEVAIYNSITRMGMSVALYDSTANNGNSVAFYKSNTNGGRCFAAFNSTASNAGISLYNSNLIAGQSVAVFNSTAQNGSTIAAFKSLAKNVPGISMFNSKMEGNTTKIGSTSIVMYDSTLEMYYPYVFSVSAMDVTSPYLTAPADFFGGIAKYNSHIRATPGIKVYSAINCGGEERELSDYTFPISNIICKYNSTAIGMQNIAEHNSCVRLGTSAAIAMYNSTISSTQLHIPQHDRFGTYNTQRVIAMYNSTIANEMDKIKLWNNSITIEPSGYINKIRYIDTTEMQQIIDFNALGYLHTLGYKELIIG